MNSQEWKQWIADYIPYILEGSGINFDSIKNHEDLTIKSNWKRVSKTKVKSLVSAVKVNQRVFEHQSGLQVTTQDTEGTGQFSASVSVDPKDYKVCVEAGNDIVFIQPNKSGCYIDQDSVIPLYFYAGLAEEVCEAGFQPLNNNVESFVQVLEGLGMAVERTETDLDEEDEQELDEGFPTNTDFHEAMAKFMNSQAQPSGYSNGDMLNLIDNISKRVLYSLTNSKLEKNEAFINLRNEIKEIMEQESANYKE